MIIFDGYLNRYIISYTCTYELQRYIIIFRRRHSFNILFVSSAPVEKPPTHTHLKFIKVRILVWLIVVLLLSVLFRVYFIVSFTTSIVLILYDFQSAY